MKLLQNKKHVIVFEDCEYVECSEDFFCMKIDCLYGIVSSGNYKKTLCNGCDDDGSKEWHKITIKLCTHCWEELLYKSKKLKIIEFFFTQILEEKIFLVNQRDGKNKGKI